MIGNLIININVNSKDAERKSQAISYAVDEIEVIKSEGYREIYNDKGIIQEDIIYEQDINDKSGNFTGYHKKVIIKDYVLIQNDSTKKSNIVKQVIVQISYRFKNQDKTVELATYVTKE